MNYTSPLANTPCIREREWSDLPQAEAALRSVYESDGYPVEGVTEATAWLCPPGLLNSWVAYHDGTIVGHVAVTEPRGEDAVRFWISGNNAQLEHTAVLGRLFVTQGARNQSVGELLVRKARKWASRRALRLVLDVMAKDAAATRLYERLGWQHIGTTTHAYGEGLSTPAACYVAPPDGTT